MRADLIADPILRDFRPFHGHLATNFVLPIEIAERVDERLTGRLQPIYRHQGILPSPHPLELAVAQHQAEVKEQLLEALSEVPPSAFEELIGVLLEHLGYEDSEVRGRSGDGGIDVVATLRLHGMTSVPTVIQAKRWKSAVPGRIVRQLRGALKVDERGVVITTAHFTKDAIAEAEAPGKSPIGLVDGPQLVELLIAQGIGVTKRPLSVWSLDPQALVQGGNE